MTKLQIWRTGANQGNGVKGVDLWVFMVVHVGPAAVT